MAMWHPCFGGLWNSSMAFEALPLPSLSCVWDHSSPLGVEDHPVPGTECPPSPDILTSVLNLSVASW